VISVTEKYQSNTDVHEHRNENRRMSL